MRKSLKHYRDAWKDILTYGNHIMFLPRKIGNHKDVSSPWVNLYIEFDPNTNTCRINLWNWKGRFKNICRKMRCFPQGHCGALACVMVSPHPSETHLPIEPGRLYLFQKPFSSIFQPQLIVHVLIPSLFIRHFLLLLGMPLVTIFQFSTKY